MCIRDSLRIHKLIHPVDDLAISHLHGTNLDDLILYRRESLGLDIEHHIVPIETPVSYTHLDVYKRQTHQTSKAFR